MPDQYDGEARKLVRCISPIGDECGEMKVNGMPCATCRTHRDVAARLRADGERIAELEAERDNQEARIALIKSNLNYEQIVKELDRLAERVRRLEDLLRDFRSGHDMNCGSASYTGRCGRCAFFENVEAALADAEKP